MTLLHPKCMRSIRRILVAGLSYDLELIYNKELQMKNTRDFFRFFSGFLVNQSINLINIYINNNKYQTLFTF